MFIVNEDLNSAMVDTTYQPSVLTLLNKTVFLEPPKSTYKVSPSETDGYLSMFLFLITRLTPMSKLHLMDPSL